MKNRNEIKVFLALLRAGLWGKTEDIKIKENTDFSFVYVLAEEQTLIGVITAGLEIVNRHDSTTKFPQDFALQLIGATLQIEQANVAMNTSLAQMVKDLKGEGIYALLVKGQGIAQCYNRPLWRSSGDIDLLFSEDNYRRADVYFTKRASRVDEEDSYSLHKSFNVEGWEVELHGSLRNRLGKKVDDGINKAHVACFKYGEVRVWNNNGTDIYLPAPINDVVFVFTHILGHFFKGGVGLRQVCDWCRLLWTYKDNIERMILESKIREMGLMTEWKVFGALAVDYLGMPEDAMAFYSSSRIWKFKAKQVLSHIFETGNMGHNRDMSYYSKNSFLIKKTISFWRHTKDGIKLFLIFPKDSIRIWVIVMKRGFSVAFNNNKQ